jgi:hypothetical protein
MRFKTNLWTTLPALALTCTLGACGGGGGDSSPGGGGSGGGQTQAASISACLTANKTVSFAVKGINLSANMVAPYKNTTGPMTYNGQPTTGQMWFYSGAQVVTRTQVWTVTNSGVTFIAWVAAMPDGSVTVGPINETYPSNMSPGQSVNFTAQQDNGTFNGTETLVGFETITLAGKTFTNTCHTRNVVNGTVNNDGWYAPGYGIIKIVYYDGSTYQYDGDLP